MAYPQADTVTAEPPVVAPTHTEAEEEYLADLHAELTPEANLAYVQYFLARTPAHLQADMKVLVEANLPNPPDPPALDPNVARIDPLKPYGDRPIPIMPVGMGAHPSDPALSPLPRDDSQSKGYHR